MRAPSSIGPTLLTQPGLTVARCVPGPRQARTRSRTCPLRGFRFPRLALSSREPAADRLSPACGSRGARPGDFCHPNPLARKAVTKRTPLAADKPPRDSWSGRYGEPAVGGTRWLRWLRCFRNALYRKHYKTRRRAKQRVRASHRQRRPMPGLTRSGARMPAPPGPNMLVGEHAQWPPLPACPGLGEQIGLPGMKGIFVASTPSRARRRQKGTFAPVITSRSRGVADRNANPGLAGASTRCVARRAAGRSPTFRGSSPGQCAEWPPSHQA